jgi:hypothetical protein
VSALRAFSFESFLPVIPEFDVLCLLTTKENVTHDVCTRQSFEKEISIFIAKSAFRLILSAFLNSNT